MHVKPKVRPGEEVSIGSLLGTFIRTNYFSYHHVPHMHVEVCRDGSLRPTRAAPLRVLMPVGVEAPLEELKVKVEVVEDGYALCSVEEAKLGIVGSVRGAPILVNGQLGVRAEYLGLLACHGGVRPGAKVRVSGVEVGYVKVKVGGGWIALTDRVSFREWLYSVSLAYMSKGLAPQPKLSASCGELPIRGVELMLSAKWPLKLIPWQGQSLDHLWGRRVHVKLERRSA